MFSRIMRLFLRVLKGFNKAEGMVGWDEKSNRAATNDVHKERWVRQGAFSMDPKRFGIAPKPAVVIMSRSEKRPNYDDLCFIHIWVYKKITWRDAAMIISCTNSLLSCCGRFSFATASCHIAMLRRLVGNQEHKCPPEQCDRILAPRHRSSGNSHHHWHMIPWTLQNGAQAFGHKLCARQVPSVGSTKKNARKTESTKHHHACIIHARTSTAKQLKQSENIDKRRKRVTDLHTEKQLWTKNLDRWYTPHKVRCPRERKTVLCLPNSIPSLLPYPHGGNTTFKKMVPCWSKYQQRSCNRIGGVMDA